MPKMYEAIRDSLVAKGVPLREAKQRAARIYNAKRKKGQRPVTGTYEEEKRRRGSVLRLHRVGT